MTILHVVQIALAVAVLGLVVERVRSLAFVSAIDAAPLRARLVRYARAGEVERAARLVEAALPAWPAQCVRPLLDPELDPPDRALEVEEGLMSVEARATRGMRALRISASIASALGFVGAVTELWWIYNGDHGIMDLQLGLVESIGLNRAILSIGLGIGTSSLALGSWTVLKKIAKRRLEEARRMVSSLEDALDAPKDARPGGVPSGDEAE